MLDRIRAFFGGAPAPAGTQRRADELGLAAAVLLVEAARLDGIFDASERATIERVLRRRFELSADEATALLTAAEEAQAEHQQLLPYTRIIKQRFDEAERIQLVEMLWEVVYADDVLHDYEASLLRRIGGLIYVTDRDRGAARRRVLARKRASEAGRTSKPDLRGE
jgi:uncharacterized tellurite resistance protein B-like protein